jgi:acyl-CoA reductase-like NAD-dependent aldehyde dehydrogenase
MKERKMLIDGLWIAGNNYFEVRNPFNDNVLAKVPEATPENVKSAVAAARKAFAQIKIPAYRRSEILENTSRLIAQNKKDLAITISMESGKPIKSSRNEVDRAVLTFKFAAEEAKRVGGEIVPMDAAPGFEKHFGFYIREPLGVVAALAPFNFPLNLVAHKVAPAFAAGNAVVLKPASSTPLCSLKLGEILLEAGLPPGVINIVTGKGSSVGEALVSNERINMVTFTGSPSVGRRIKRLVGMAKVTLELGSNSAAIIDESADLEMAVPRCVIGAFSYSGQVCISIQRLYVNKNIFDRFLYEFIQKTEELKIGDPLSEDTDIGPMINEEAAKRVLAWIQEAEREGARIITGGRREGRFLTPTVLTDIKPDMKIMCLEAFAPVVSIVPFEKFEEAIEMVNDSIYGLQTGVYTRNINNAFKAIKELQVGGVMINEIPTFRADHMPYGGIKESGIGREGLKFAVEEMTNIKMVNFNLGELK